jgi:hypothetical protein
VRRPDWSPYIVAVLAGGPSVSSDDIFRIRYVGRVIAVNTSYKKAIWADALYATDLKWWKFHQGAIDFPGMKICTGGKGVETRFPDVHTFQVPPPKDPRRPQMILDDSDYIGTGGNSGFQALNVAIKFGAKRIMLLGFDFHLRGGTHHHGDHPSPLHNPDDAHLESWRDKLDAQAFRLNAHGISVVNCSRSSSLQNYRKLSVVDALEMWANEDQAGLVEKPRY